MSVAGEKGRGEDGPTAFGRERMRARDAPQPNRWRWWSASANQLDSLARPSILPFGWNISGYTLSPSPLRPPTIAPSRLPAFAPTVASLCQPSSLFPNAHRLA
jgi:hypothetical protein